MTKYFFSLALACVVFSVVSVSGCAESKPASVTEDLDQSAIEAYKENERRIEEEAMGEMELGQ